MARVFAILAIVATISAVSFSLPRVQSNGNNELESAEIIESVGEQQVGIPTDVLIEALERQFEGGDLARGAVGSLFNLSAYINAPGRPAGTALTFVPLITLLSGLIGGNVAG